MARKFSKRALPQEILDEARNEDKHTTNAITKEDSKKIPVGKRRYPAPKKKWTDGKEFTLFSAAFGLMIAGLAYLYVQYSGIIKSQSSLDEKYTSITKSIGELEKQRDKIDDKIIQLQIEQAEIKGKLGPK